MSSISPERPVALAQRPLPELGPADPVELAAPPAPPDHERGWLAMLLPGLSALGMLGFALLSPNVFVVALCGGFALLSAVGAAAGVRLQRRQRERAWAERSERYQVHLRSCVETLADAGIRHRAHSLAIHPAPECAEAAVAAGAVWERTIGEPGHLQVRLGLGRMPARRAPRRSGGDPGAEQALLADADDAARRYAATDGIPITLDLAGAPAVVFSGTQLPLLRALIVSLTRAHGPAAVRLHGVMTEAELTWLRLLPQAGCLATDAGQLMSELPAALRHCADSAQPHHVIVVAPRPEAAERAWQQLAPLFDRRPAASMSLLGLLAAQIPTPQAATVCVTGDAEGALLLRGIRGGPEHVAITLPDALTHAAATRYAESVRRCLAAPAATQGRPPALRLESLLAGVAREPLQVPIGVDSDGRAALLDLREAAREGDGPHGLIIGATGSGKSELLRTLLMALAHQNPPDELTFLLVDFKGGAALAQPAALPHTAGLLTNLNADPHAVDRLCASLRAELHRRQALLRGAGADNLEVYRGEHSADPGREPLPRLLVVVDEYAELIEQSPDVLDVLTSLARLGRSLGIHLLLCSQRLDDGRLRGLEAHLRYRICLRTFTAAESISAIGSPLAAKLPPSPGHGYVSRDGELTRIRIALVDDPAAGARAVKTRLGNPRQTRQLCPPPLPETLTLDPTAAGKTVAGQAAIGLRDLPELGCQLPLTVDLATDGHLAIVGPPRSGRSTALTTLVTGLASATPVRELAVHVIAPAGGPLAATTGLPHVGTVATSPELARRVITAVAESVTERRAAPTAPGSRTLLVIDDAGALLEADDRLASALNMIATTGQSVGVTLAVSGGRWADLRGGLREALGSRFELAGGDPTDSMLPRVASRITERPPGRILTGDGSWAQLALPRVDAIAEVARRGGPATQPIQLLPELVPSRSLPRPSGQDSIVLGVTGPYVRPFEIGLAPGRHLLVLGNSGSGRSGLLRSLAASCGEQGARTWLVDPRRSLTRVAGPALRRARSVAEAADLLRELRAGCRARPSDIRRNVLIVDDQELLAGRGGQPDCLTPLLELLPHAADLGLSVIIARRLSGYARAGYEPFFGGFLELCESAVVLSGDPAEGPVIGGVRPARLPPGRGQLVLRGEPAGEVHVAWFDDVEPIPARAQPGPVTAVAGADLRCGM